MHAQATSPFRSIRRTELSVMVALAILPSGATQAQHAHHANSPAPVWTSAYRGLHHQVSTTIPEAQSLFDQGLLLTYAFNHDAAGEAFRRAAELDPNLAMAHWGVALSLGSNINSPVTPERSKAAFEAIQRATALSTYASPKEQAFIRALAARYSPDPAAGLARLDMNYAQAMRALAARYPDDLDAATLLAESLMVLRPWRLWELNGRPADGTLEILEILESVLIRDPDHLGANHYYIHAVEASPWPERALPAAERLDRLRLDAGHLAHMPGHIFLRLGDYDRLVQSNEAAVRADEAFFKTTAKTGGAYPGYYAHNLEFLVVGHVARGAFAKARQAADKFDLTIAEIVKRSPGAENKHIRRISVPLRFNAWDEVLSLPAPGPNKPVTTAFWRYARAIAHAGKGEIGAAERERAAFVAARQAVSSAASAGENDAARILNIAERVMDGKIALAKGRTAESISSLTAAVALEDSLPYDEPPDWYYPVRESLGAALLLAGKPAEAEAVFREDLRRNRRNPRSLFGLRESLRAQAKHEAARLVDQQFRKAWTDADTQLDVRRL